MNRFYRNTAKSLWRTPASAFAFLLVAAGLPGFAASSSREPADLGQGLRYLRVHQLADAIGSFESVLSQGAPLVLDLRYATATSEDAPHFSTALGKQTGAAPLFILVSPQSPANLLPSLTKPRTGVLTLGIEASLPAPTVVVRQAAEVDREAFNAFESGVPLDTLIGGRIQKERFDEATLVKEFNSGNLNAEPPPEPDPAKPAAEKPPALVDRVLQRAVHLSRALTALKRG